MNELHPVPSNEAPAEEAASSSESLIEADDLIEEVSIDGMCGVY
ncbi:mycofactocin precursor MftA [Streptomyces sp. NPDC020802]